MFLKSIIDRFIASTNKIPFLKNYPTKAIRGLCSSSIPILCSIFAINKNSVVEQDVGFKCEYISSKLRSVEVEHRNYWCSFALPLLRTKTLI